MDLMLRALRSAVRSRPGLLVILTVVVSAGFGALASQQVQEQGFENFVPDNEAAAASQRISDEFAGTQSTVAQIAVFAEGGDVLSPEGIGVATRLRDAVLANDEIAPVLADQPGQPPVLTYADVVLQALQAQGMDPATLDDQTVDQLYQQAMSQLPESQRGQLSSLLGGEGDQVDASAGMVLVFLQGSGDSAPGETGRVQDALLAMGDLGVQADGFEVRPFNFALLSQEVNDQIQSELSRLLGVAFLLIILILAAIFRNVLDVVAALLGLGFTIVWMQGIATLLGPSFLGWTGGMNEMTMAIPILLVGLGVDYAIHLTMRYREERVQGESPGSSSSRAIAAVGVALALATLTTMVGFSTNVTNPLPPLKDFGIFAAVGVGSAFVIMVTFVPSVRLLADRWRERRGKLKTATASRDDGHPSLLGRLAAEFTPAAVHRPWTVLAVAGVLTVVGGFGATQLSTEFSQTEFFPKGSDALQTVNSVQEAFGGDLAESTQVLVEGDVASPDALAGLAALQENLRDDADVRTFDGQAQAESVVSRIRQIAQQAQAAQQAGGQSPAAGDQSPAASGAAAQPAADPQAVATLLQQAQQAGLLGPGSISDDADVQALYDALLAVDPSAGSLLSEAEDGGGYDAAVVRISTNAGDDVTQLVDDLDQDVAPLEQAGLDVTFTSDPILIDAVLTELRSSQVQSLVVTLLASMLILSVAFWARERKPMLGVLAIVSVGLVVAWALGLMALIGIPFNVMTAMVSALSIGIGVPFGIHVVNRYLEDRKRYDDPFDAMRLTLQHTGGALMGSALTTMAGFGVLVLASVPPFRQFGLVTAITIGLALVSSIAVLPAMLTLWDRARRDEPERAGPVGTEEQHAAV